MQCSVCGAESTPGLNYCKQCGTRLIPTRKTSPDGLNLGKLTGMFWAVAVFGLGGLMLLVGAVLGVVAMGVTGDMVGVVSIIFLLIILIISGLLIWQLSRLISIVASSTQAVSHNNTRDTEESAPLEIDSPPRVMPNVTEHTTRSFDKPSREGRRATR